MSVKIYDKDKREYISYNVISKLPGPTEYGDNNKTHTWNKLLLSDAESKEFTLITDYDCVFYFYELINGKEIFKEAGSYCKLQWEGELNAETWL